jgi:hypothetical protein
MKATDSVAKKPKTISHPPRGAAFGAAWRSLFGPRLPYPQPIWTPSMIYILIGGLILTGLAHLGDAAAIGGVRSSASPILRGMADITNVGKSQWYLVPSGVLFLTLAFFNWRGRDRTATARLAFLFGQAG